MKFQFPRMDASENAFFSRELEHIRPGLFEIEFPMLKGRQFVPVNNEPDPGAELFTYEIMEVFGDAKIISDYSKDLPSVAEKVSDAHVRVRGVGTSYVYSIQEARAAQLAGRPLDARKARTARTVVERKLDEIMLEGETDYGLKGLFNQTLADVTEYTVPNGATSGTKVWEDKTPDEVVADMHGLTSKVVEDTKEIHPPDTMIVPLSSYEHIATTRMGDGSDQTILRFFLSTNPHINTVETSQKLEAAGAGATKRATVYQRNPDILEAVHPQEFEQFPPQFDGFRVETMVHARTAGLVLYYPKALGYADGI